MKIKKIIKHKNKLLELKLIKTKIYTKNYNNFIKIEDISYKLKKALRIIYKYHVNNKRILFIGTPIHINKKLRLVLKNTKHIIIPEPAWMNGVLTNQASCFQYLSKNHKTVNSKFSKFLFQLKKQSDLVVILDALANTSALNESYTAHMPVISLNCDLNISDIRSSYKVPGKFKFTKKKIRDNFFYEILTATFKKANITKTKSYQIQKRKNQKTRNFLLNKKQC